MLKADELQRLRDRVQALREGEPAVYVRALAELGEALPASDEKAECWANAAEIYTSRFANEAEAVAAYEKVLDVVPNHGVAGEYLAQAYERRRSYDKLVALRSRRAETLQGAAKLAACKEVARLASDRLARPELAVQLWEAVLALEPNDGEAHAALFAAAKRASRPSLWARLSGWLKS